MAITTLSGLQAASGSAQWCSVFKATQTGDRAGVWHSLWGAAGYPPAGNTSVQRPTNTTVGAIPFTNPGGGQLSHLLRLAVSGTVNGSLILYDRLWHNAGMSGTQTVEVAVPGSLFVNRPDDTGFRTELWGQIYSALGSTDSTLFVKYTDQDGNLDQQAFYVKEVAGDLDTVGQMFPLQLASGDTGVGRASDYRWSGSTGAVGDFGLVLMRRLVEVPLTADGVECLYDFARLGLPRIYDNACLTPMVRLSSTSTGAVFCRLMIGAG